MRSHQPTGGTDMSHPGSEGSSPAPDEGVPAQPIGVVERLVRDDTDRKRFLKAVGGAGAASFGAFVLAACGSSSSTSSSSSSSSSAVASTAAAATSASSPSTAK